MLWRLVLFLFLFLIWFQEHRNGEPIAWRPMKYLSSPMNDYPPYIWLLQVAPIQSRLRTIGEIWMGNTQFPSWNSPDTPTNYTRTVRLKVDAQCSLACCLQKRKKSKRNYTIYTWTHIEKLQTKCLIRRVHFQRSRKNQGHGASTSNTGPKGSGLWSILYDVINTRFLFYFWDNPTAFQSRLCWKGKSNYNWCAELVCPVM